MPPILLPPGLHSIGQAIHFTFSLAELPLAMLFTAGLLSGLGPCFVAEMLKVPGQVKTGAMMSNLDPQLTAAMFKTTGDWLHYVAGA